MGEYKANMSTASAIRVRVEATLAQRVPAALTLKIKQAPELFATGMPEVDAMLDGGVPRIRAPMRSSITSPHISVRCSTISRWGFTAPPHSSTMRSVTV